MNKRVFAAVLALAVVVVAAVSAYLFFHRDSEPQPTPTIGDPIPENTPTFAPASAAPATEPQSAVSTPPPTAPPTPTPSPTAPPTPSPTPAPTPTPSPTPAPRASGSFSSDTGTKLNLLVDWEAYTNAAGARKLRVTVSVTHYSLTCGPATVTLNAGGAAHSAQAEAINYDGDGPDTTQLCVFEDVDVPSGPTDLAVTWYFNGSYSGQELPQITASAAVNLP